MTAASHPHNTLQKAYSTFNLGLARICEGFQFR